MRSATKRSACDQKIGSESIGSCAEDNLHLDLSISDDYPSGSMRRALSVVTHSQRLSSRALTQIFIAFGLALGIGCSAATTTFSSLSDQGIVPVSSENPFMGSNLFLAKEMEESSYLYNFLKERGAPQAIALQGEREDDARMIMYYSGARESYSATPHIDPTLRNREWIISGPFALDRSSYREVSQLPATQGAVFEIFGRREVLGGPLRAPETRVIAPAFVPTPKANAPRKRSPKKGTTNQSAAPSPSSPGGEPANFDQQAIAEARAKERGVSVSGSTSSVSSPGTPQSKPTRGPLIQSELTRRQVIPAATPPSR